MSIPEKRQHDTSPARLDRSRRISQVNVRPHALPGLSRELGCQKNWAFKRTGLSIELRVREHWAFKRIGLSRGLGFQENWAFKRTGLSKTLGFQKSW
jgi:hypothetical protein